MQWSLLISSDSSDRFEAGFEFHTSSDQVYKGAIIGRNVERYKLSFNRNFYS